MKSLTKIHFGGKSTREGSPIAHLSTPRIIAQDAISLVDTSNLIPQNAFFEKDIEIVLDDDDLTYFVDKSGFLITDQFSNNNQPLYYKHKLQYSIFGEGESGVTDVIIVDEAGNEVDENLWIYDCGAKTIYHRIDIMNEGVQYFIRYPRANDAGTLINRRHSELLNQQPAFREAVDEDMLPDGCLNADADAYLLEELDGQPYYWKLTLPRSGTYYLKYTDNGILKLRVPPTKQSEPWYLEVQNSVVLTTQINLNEFLRYTIAEFDLQTFYPFPPVRLVAERQTNILNTNVVSLGEKNIFLSNKTPIDIKIYNANNTLVKAMTTDPNKVGAAILGVSWEVDTIESIDKATGRISLRRSIKDSERVVASFYHEDDTFTYTGVNLNPLYNSDILNQRVAILAKPAAFPCNSTISHVILTADEIILSASDDNISDWLKEGTKTLDNLKQEWLYLPGESVGNQNNYMLIGLASVSIPYAPEEANITDARRRGGGIVDELISQALSLVPGSSQNWDIKTWDGPAVPAQGAAVLYLPSWIQQVYSEEEIRARASQYSAAGTYLVIKYY